MKKILYVMSLLIIASMALAACGPANTETAATPSEVLVSAPPVHAIQDQNASNDIGAQNAHLTKCANDVVPPEFTVNLGSGFVSFTNGGGSFWVETDKVVVKPDVGEPGFVGCGKITANGRDYYFNGVELYTKDYAANTH